MDWKWLFLTFKSIFIEYKMFQTYFLGISDSFMLKNVSRTMFFMAAVGSNTYHGFFEYRKGEKFSKNFSVETHPNHLKVILRKFGGFATAMNYFYLQKTRLR